jgi:NADPH:quinone reductase-like Zn-dependent oxidoreductase
MATTPEIPTEMNAAAIDQFGEVIHTERLPVPELGKREVLIQVATAGVGEWDPALIDGSFKIGADHFPRVFGSDGAGTVVAIGSGVTRVDVGDPVYGWGLASAKGGFFAEYAAIHENDVARIPRTVAFEQAGALAVSGITALQGLESLELEEGQSLLLIGASGGVGHVALQLAKRMGLRVFAVASKDDGVELVRRLGADEVADGRKGFLRLARAFAPDGFDAALVFAGGRGWKDELELVIPKGRVAWPNGVEPAPKVPKRVTGKAYDAEDSPSAFDRLNELVSRGPFHIELSKTYSLDEAAKAMKDVERHHVGKLVLRIH